jgi:hypothetical protein
MLKLYVLIRDDIAPAQQAVQAGHAVAELMQKMTTQEIAEWQENNTLVYLSVSNIYYWKQALEDGGFKHAMFHEPDYTISKSGYPFARGGTDTAIAVAPNWHCQYLLFKGLPLALQGTATRKRWWNR